MAQTKSSGDVQFLLSTPVSVYEYIGAIGFGFARLKVNVRNKVQC